MKKLLGFCAFISLVIGLVFWLKYSPVHASNNDYLLSDGVFDNANTMSAAHIDSWLNSNFPSSCISTNNGFTASDPTGYSPNPSQFFYSSTPVSAGKIIYDAAQAYGINPQVLLTTLQKEETLVDGSAGCSSWRYASAVGYGCTDSGTNTHDYSYPNGGLVTPLYYTNGNPINSISGSCVNSGPKTGFSEQIIHAAWLLAFSRHKSEGDTGWAVIKGNWNNCDDNNTCPVAWNIPASEACYSGYMTQGTFKRCPTDSSAIFYDGYATIDGQSIHMDTGATAALYVYTPHIQNFDTIFTSWFGSPRGLDYDYQYIGVSFSGASTSANVQGNTQVTVTLTAENIGNQSWSNTNYPVRVGTWSPTNHQSPLYDSSWASSARPATLNQSVVQPGQNGTFTFKINIPNRSGLYQEMFNLVAEGSAWMSSGFELDLNVTPSVYTWQMVPGSQTSTAGFDLVSGQSATFSFQAKNTSNVAWNNGAVNLATWAPSYRTSLFNDGSWPSQYRAATATAAQWPVQPCSVDANHCIATFSFNIRAPSVASTKMFVERFNLVMEGVSWFTDPWFEFDVNVHPAQYTYQMVPGSQTSDAGSFSLSTNQATTFHVQFKNTGNVTWDNSVAPVKLATWNPPYSHSPFDPGTWEGPYRVATMQGGPIKPCSVDPNNCTATFSFPVKMPAAPGQYNERFNLVMEGISWFTDPWFEFDVQVH